MSASWITTTSPVVRAIPVRTAAPFPRLRSCWSTVSPFDSSNERRIDTVSSVDPSSTAITSVRRGSS